MSFQADPSYPQPRSNQRRNIFILVLAGLGLLGIGIARGKIPFNIVWSLSVLIPSVIVHEVAHGVVALRFGDKTAQRAGRLTLDPSKHVDPLGTVIMPAMLAIAQAPVFGYAKPVPVNPAELRSPRDQMVWVSLSGPGVNIAIALLAAAALHLSVWPELVIKGWLYVGLVNVVLATFNLIPIPPLDGSAVLERFLPQSMWPGYLKFRPYAMLLLLAIVFFGQGILDRIFDPAVRLWFDLLPVSGPSS